ncbi:hypothetical protein DLD82_09005 [Methanospirillum stamsii]|uniref:Uncharacterized protein n=1 Tax=Methanospirillum stamsii TaxID=1277351 RepID=A0A2V2MZR7_9EURY|nr:hypothetical protein DLD82_09005 [Methanospirillum stamsii]
MCFPGIISNRDPSRFRTADFMVLFTVKSAIGSYPIVLCRCSGACGGMQGVYTIDRGLRMAGDYELVFCFP